MNLYSRKYQFIEKAPQILVDLVCIVLSMALARVIRYGGIRTVGMSTEVFRQMMVVMFLVDLLVQYWTDGYAHYVKRGYLKEFKNVLMAALAMFVGTGFFVYAFRLEMGANRLVLLIGTALFVLLDFLARILAKRFMRGYFQRSSESEKLLVVTNEEALSDVLEHLGKDESWSYEIVGVAILDGVEKELGDGKYPLIYGRETVMDFAMSHAVDAVFFHCPGENRGNLEVLIQSFLAMGCICHDAVRMLNVDAPWTSLGKHIGYPVISYSLTHFDHRARLIKKVFDYFVGLVGSIVTILLIPIVGLAIKLDSKGPIFFAQWRIGKNGRRFKIYKFRSMVVDAEEQKKELMSQNEVEGLMFKMKRDPRITRVGAFLRKTSLDEFPQFFNILRGEMSLVGTRPPTEEEFKNYNVYYRRRLSLLPGLTGLWQVSGRSDIKDFEEVVKLDLQYIDNWSIGEDIKIIWKTIGVVLGRKGSE